MDHPESSRRGRNSQPQDEEASIEMKAPSRPHRESEDAGLDTGPTEHRSLLLGAEAEKHHPQHHHFVRERAGLARFSDRFLRRGKPKVGTLESLKNVALSSWLNAFLLFIPLAWVAHFGNVADEEHAEKVWPYWVTFLFCFLAILPLEKLFDYLGEELAIYCGKDFGDLIIISLNNAVEATLAILLLTKCELKILQSTIVGVVALHLLLIPGVSFIIGGARIIHQDLHPHFTELNHTLLAIGVLSLLLPAAFFSTLSGGATGGDTVVTEHNQLMFLQMSRGMAIILLTVYIASRIYLHNPPGDNNSFGVHESAPEALKREEYELERDDPKVSQWVAIALLAVAVALMAVTAEFLVGSIEFVKEEGHIGDEWFGLILLPIVAWSADAWVTGVYFLRITIKGLLGFGEPEPPSTLAKARGIEMSVQFTLFWMPMFVLIGWWTNRPLTLLFDIFEVAVFISACFIVNYVTSDAKTNWAEGYGMVAFYVIIALCSWFYAGQETLQLFNACAGGEAGETGGAEAGGAEAGGH